MKPLARQIALRAVVASLRLCGLPHGHHGPRHAVASPPPSVAVIGFLQTASGLGAAARGISRVLADRSPTLVSMSALALTSPLPTGMPSACVMDPNSAPGDDVAIHVYNPDVFLAAIRRYGTRLLRANDLNIAVVNWETDLLPPRWAGVLSLYDTLCAPSSFTARAVARATGRPVHVVPNHVPARSPRVRVATEPRFEFLCMFDHHSDFDRKNPLAAVRAFRAATRMLPARTSCRLRIKCHAATPAAVIDRLRHESADAAIEILDETLDQPGMERLWNECDCLVSLHRSEGFGLPVAEALARAIPVITTRQGGVLDFVDDGGCFFVSGEAAERRESVSSYAEWSGWIEPDIAVAASQMLAVMGDYDAAVDRARRGWQRLAEVACGDAVHSALERAMAGSSRPIDAA